MGYASVAGVEWVVLTDGNEYRIYNAHASVPVEEKLFRTIRLTDDDPQIAETLGLLSKPGLQENRLEAHWQAQFVDRQVQAVLKGLFAPEPDASLIRLLRRRLDDLSRRDIEESLRRVRARFEFPVEPTADRLPMPAPTVEDAPRVKRSPARLGVSLAGLIAAGLVKPPLDLHTTYKSVALTATVEANGTVTFRGESFRSLSTAGGMARLAAGYTSSTRRVPQTNGWTFWEFTGADGQEKPIDALRQRFVAERDMNRA